MKVKATNKYQELNVEDKYLGRKAEKGEIFEVSKERFKVLSGDNRFKEVFVEAVEDIEIETATKKVKTETAVKKTTAKKATKKSVKKTK